eukprot:scaffold16628_cov48-Prasinocladus_malaysianus.AAC.3
MDGLRAEWMTELEHLKSSVLLPGPPPMPRRIAYGAAPGGERDRRRPRKPSGPPIQPLGPPKPPPGGPGR